MIIRPLIKSDLMSLLQFTTQGPLEVFTSDLIPEVFMGKNQKLKRNFLKKKNFNFSGLRRFTETNGRVLQNRTKTVRNEIQRLVT